MSILNRVTLILTLLLLFVFFQITRGQELGFTILSVVSHGGFHNGEPVWRLANGVGILTGDPVINQHMKDLEGKKVKITVQLAQ